MTTPTQLTLDGREVEMEAVSRYTRFGKSQRAVMRELGFRGSLTSTQAGIRVHDARGHCGSGIRSDGDYDGAGCCPYAATDGGAVLKTLARRGIVEKIGGLWYGGEQ